MLRMRTHHYLRIRSWDGLETFWPLHHHFYRICSTTLIMRSLPWCTSQQMRLIPKHVQRWQRDYHKAFSRAALFKTWWWLQNGSINLPDDIIVIEYVDDVFIISHSESSCFIKWALNFGLSHWEKISYRQTLLSLGFTGFSAVSLQTAPNEIKDQLYEVVMSILEGRSKQVFQFWKTMKPSFIRKTEGFRMISIVST